MTIDLTVQNRENAYTYNGKVKTNGENGYVWIEDK
jgi:hypothetical protein